MAIETNLQPFPVCPHCGHIERDAWEINFGAGLDGDTDVSCNNCGVEYFCCREVTVYYSTEPKVKGAPQPETPAAHDGAIAK